MKNLINFLLTIGEIQQCKKKGSQGIMIYEPSFFDDSTLVALCKAAGVTRIYNKADDELPNRLFIGKVNKKVLTAEEAENFLSSF
tara:strand:+ start:68 stop:322 length:255 start_codon:yes stop_codon:yes gene_type:complete